jgi:hypothetical protein
LRFMLCIQNSIAIQQHVGRVNNQEKNPWRWLAYEALGRRWRRW